MSRISLTLPTGAVQSGELLDSYSGLKELLNQDITQVKLPSGITIDVGWVPENDPSGHFVVVAFRDYWDDQEQAPIHVRSPSEVASLVMRLAVAFANPPMKPKPTPTSITSKTVDAVSGNYQSIAL